MSFKSNVVKTAIKCTPNRMIVWVGNKVLKGIAELTDFNFDLNARTVYVKTTLSGEAEAIEVWINDFAIVSNGESYQFFIQKAESNKLWLNNILMRVVGKEWKIPVTPKLKAHVELMAEVFKAKN